MELLIFFIFSIFLIIGIFVFAIFFAIKKIKKIKELCANIKFSFFDSQEAIDRIKTIPDIFEYKNQSNAPSFFIPILKPLNFWLLEGKYNGIKIFIYPERRGGQKYNNIYTIFKAFFNLPLSVGLEITKDSIFFKRKEILLDTQNIKTGNQEFDNKTIVKGNDVDKIKTILQKSNVKDLIMSFFNTQNYTYITEQWGMPVSEEFYKNIIEKITELVKAIED